MIPLRPTIVDLAIAAQFMTTVQEAFSLLSKDATSKSVEASPSEAPKT
jgi:hypothetical protein